MSRGIATSTRTVTAGVGVFVLALALWSGCGPTQDCPEPTFYELQEGSYQLESERSDSEDESMSGQTFPHADVGEKSVEVDKEAGVVKVRYEKDGESVVETWKITSTTRRGR